MKKVMLFMFVLVLVFSQIATVKPPRIVRLELINKAGEPTSLELTGTGYDFEESAYVWPGGTYWWLAHQDPPKNPATNEYMNVPAYKNYTLPKDRYIIAVHYKQEIDDSTVACLINWTPDGYDNGSAYFDLDRNRKLTIGKCNAIPKVLPGRKNDAVKWARWLFVVK